MDVDLAVAALYIAVTMPLLWILSQLFRFRELGMRRLLVVSIVTGAFAPFLWRTTASVASLVVDIPLMTWALCWVVSCGWAAGLAVRFWGKTDWVRSLKFAAIFGLGLGLVVDTLDVMAIGSYHVPTESMRPTLQVGDYLLIVRRPSGHRLARHLDLALGFRPAERGDLLVFDYPEDDRKLFLKRCIGLPGETIQLSDGDVTIDGKPLIESYRLSERNPLRSLKLKETTEPIQIQPGNYYVLGDNRDNSQDSRFFGTIAYDGLFGRAVAIYWPPWRARWL